MGQILSRCVALDEHPVTADDLDADGSVSDEAVQRWLTTAQLAYLDRCVALRREQAGSGHELTLVPRTVPSGSLLGNPASVAVSASVSEVRPMSFTISLRVRPLGGERHNALNATCTVRLDNPATGAEQPLGDEIRDELIALEHAAPHFN